MATMVNLPASVLRSPVLLATALRTGELGDNTASVLTVLSAANQTSEFKSEDLNEAINSWYNATNKRGASARIAAILESRAKELASIVAQASENFLGTVRFVSRKKILAEINAELKAPAVRGSVGEFVAVQRMSGTLAKKIIFGAELAKIVEAGFEKVKKKLLIIPGGTFQMGYDGRNAYYFEKPAHEVSVSTFQMSEDPETTGEYGAWERSLGENRFFLVRLYPKTGWPRVIAQGDKVSIEAFKSKVPNLATLGVWEVESNYHPKDSKQGEAGPSYPMNDVSWHQSYLYAFMHGCRLPTEAEWAFAVTRSGRYQYLSESGARNAAHDVEMVQGPVVAPSPRRYIERNPDIGEWVMDWLGEYPSGAVTDPKGSVTSDKKVYIESSKKVQVGRIYYFHDTARFARVSERGFDPPTSKSYWIGFRLVRPQQKALAK